MVQPNLRIRELLHREFTIEHDVEGERLGLGARFDVLGNAAEPVGNSRDLFLGEPSHFPRPVSVSILQYWICSCTIRR